MDKESKDLIIKGLVAIPYWAIGLYISMAIFSTTTRILSYFIKL